MQKSIIPDEILLDLILSFDQELDFEQLIDNALSKFKKKLNCKAVCLYVPNIDGTYTLSKSYPLNNTEELDCYNKYFAKTMVAPKAQLGFFETQLNETSYYSFKLHENNWLLLVREKTFNQEVLVKIKEIIRVFNNQLKLNAKTKSYEVQLQDLLLRMASRYIKTGTLDEDEVINSSLQEIGSFLKVDRAYIFEYDFINKTTSNTYEWCAENISPEIEKQQNVPISRIPKWITACKNNKSVRPYMGSNGLRAILGPNSIKSSITLPMINSGKLIGFIGFDSIKNMKKYTETEENLLLVYSEIMMNIGLRQKYESELINQKERFHRIIRSIDLGLIEVDHSFTIVFANQSFLKFYGYPWSDLVGQNIFDTILKENDDEKNLKQRLSNIENKEGYTGEIATFDREGVKKIVFISIVIYYDDKGMRRYLGAIVDLSPQKRLEQELRYSMRKTEEASKAKELFLANMSHELRTPLNIINGAITEIIKEKTSKDTLFMLNQAIAASTHMLHLVNNILDFAKINAGEISLERKDFELTTTLKKTFNILSPLAKEKGISYELGISQGIHKYVIGDFGKINQILINLLGNSIKFTETGYVKLQVNLKHNYRNRQTLEFVIEDSGIGMNADFLEKIFEEFQQDTLVNNIQSGTGLGMPISKRFVNLMGGELEVESKKNHGTRISFCIDFEKRNRTIYEEKTALGNTLLNGKKLLIVEDNYMNALILERKLIRAGANVKKVHNGQLALDLISKTKFDLVLMDIQMPVMDGIKTTKAIRKLYGNSLPIIAVTANVFKNSIDEYLNAGMNNVITKPFEDRFLFSKILESLEIVPEYTAIKNTIPKNPKTKKNGLYSIDYLKQLSNGDAHFFNLMIGVFNTLAKNSIDKLAVSIENKDLDSIKRTVHKLRASLTDMKIESALNLAEYLDGPQPINLEMALIKSSDLIKILKAVSEDLEEKYM